MRKFAGINTALREWPAHTPIYPVWNVESPVRSQSGKVMGRNGFRLTRPLQHE